MAPLDDLTNKERRQRLATGLRGLVELKLHDQAELSEELDVQLASARAEAV